MEIRNWMKGTSEQRGPCRVGTGALFVHRRSAWPGPGRALLLWVPRVGWSEEKWPRCPTTLCDLPEGRQQGPLPARCWPCWEGKGTQGKHWSSLLSLQSQTSIILLLCGEKREVSKKSVISLLSPICRCKPEVWRLQQGTRRGAGWGRALPRAAASPVPWH